MRTIYNLKNSSKQPFHHKCQIMATETEDLLIMGHTHQGS